MVKLEFVAKGYSTRQPVVRPVRLRRGARGSGLCTSTVLCRFCDNTQLKHAFACSHDLAHSFYIAI